MPGSLPPFQAVQDSATDQNFRQITQAWSASSASTPVVSAPNVPARLVTGSFTGTAPATIVLAGTGDWSVSRTTTGTYVVTFTVAFTAANVIPLCNGMSGVGLPRITASSATAFTVEFYNVTGALADIPTVVFHAWGPA